MFSPSKSPHSQLDRAGDQALVRCRAFVASQPGLRPLDLGGGNFGISTVAGDPRIMEFGMKLIF